MFRGEGGVPHLWKWFEAIIGVVGGVLGKHKAVCFYVKHKSISDSRKKYFISIDNEIVNSLNLSKGNNLHCFVYKNLIIWSHLIKIY